MELRAMEFTAAESVWLRLVRGDAREPVRVLPADLADGAVSVGTADSCDWQIEADGVPPVALYLKAIAGSLFVRPSGAAALRVDGHGVGSIWMPVERGARLAIGAALIEVGLAGRSRNAQHTLLGRAFDQPRARAAELEPHPDAAMNPPVHVAALPREPAAVRAHELALDSAHEPPDEYELRARAGDVWAAHDSRWSATIFGAEELALACANERSGAAYVRGWGSTSFVIAGSLLACAYGCWVLLLDYF